MSAVLRRWDRRTFDEQVIELATTYVCCARCGRMAPFHLVERDERGEWVHTGNCPYTPASAPVAAPPPPAPRARTPVIKRERALKPDPASVAAVQRTVARHAATMQAPAVTPPEGVTARAFHRRHADDPLYVARREERGMTEEHRVLAEAPTHTVGHFREPWEEA